MPTPTDLPALPTQPVLQRQPSHVQPSLRDSMPVEDSIHEVEEVDSNDAFTAYHGQTMYVFLCACIVLFINICTCACIYIIYIAQSRPPRKWTIMTYLLPIATSQCTRIFSVCVCLCVICRCHMAIVEGLCVHVLIKLTHVCFVIVQHQRV